MYKTVIDEFNHEITIDTNRRQVLDYNNKEQKIHYYVKIAHKNKYTTYLEKGILKSLPLRINIDDSKLRLMYEEKVRYDADRYDPDRIIWSKFLKDIKENEDKYFVEYGDYKPEYLLTDEDRIELSHKLSMGLF